MIHPDEEIIAGANPTIPRPGCAAVRRRGRVAVRRAATRGVCLGGQGRLATCSRSKRRSDVLVETNALFLCSTRQLGVKRTWDA